MVAISGLKVLLVEDEGGVALLIEDMLQDFGCEIVASVAHLNDACGIASTGAFDLAILDVNLDGRPAFPVAKILRERCIPFLFSTGYGAGGLPDEFRDRPVIAKPFLSEELRRKMSMALESKPHAGGKRPDQAGNQSHN